MPKNSEMLAAIVERVKDLPEMKKDIKDIKERQGNHETRVSLLEAEHKKPLHNGLIGLLARIFFFGK